MFTANNELKTANVSRDDSRPLKGVEHNDSLFFPKRIEARQPIIITGLKKNQPRRIDLSNQVAFDLLVRGITADIKDDDGNKIQDNTNNQYRFSYVQFIIQTLEKGTDRVIGVTNIYLSSYPNYQNELTLSPKELYLVTVNKDVNLIKLNCEPLIQSAPVIFSPPVISTVPERNPRQIQTGRTISG